MTGIALIIAFFFCIVAMILAISKLKVHPFLAILGVAIVLGLLAGIPIVNRTDAYGDTEFGLAVIMGQGFSAIFSGIGLVIIFGALIGAMLEVTGGAFKIADMVVRLLGKASPVLALTIMGWIISIPVFCDSGYVLLNPVRRSIVKRTGASAVATATGLGAGLFISHSIVPLTPGPLGVADILNLSDYLLLIMILSIIVSIPLVIASYLWAKRCGKRTQSLEDIELQQAETVKSYDDLVAEFGGLPNGLLSLSPILVPIIALALGSISSVAGWTGRLAEWMAFIGTPVIALGIGVLFAIVLLAVSRKMDSFNALTNDTLKTLGPILFITAAGSVLGRVIAVSDMVPFISTHYTVLAGLGMFFPFIVAAILKTALGSTTVAMITTGGIMGPLMVTLGWDSPIMAALTVIAIGVGGMVASHANDSYFWVVTNLSDMTPEQGYRNWTSTTVVLGIVGALTVFLLSFVVRWLPFINV
ncbi:MAG: GntP family permease [Promicromonosporaceae bacterium]|nr:GntP family permease [Promicromonosporaceae bacterium]